VHQTHLEHCMGDTEQNGGQPETICIFLDLLGCFWFQGDEPDGVGLGNALVMLVVCECGRYIPS
jgi:hypothetical protein